MSGSVITGRGSVLTSAGDDGQGTGAFGSGAPGPTALGSSGAATTARRSDQAPAAYRSDLPLSTAWFVDPVAGDDNATGITAAAALRTLTALRRRWWNADITSDTTVTILGHLPNSDGGAWRVNILAGAIVTFTGTLGAVTGFSGRAIDNTLFSGVVTGAVEPTTAPQAADLEFTDSSLPVSFTASGLMAMGVVFRRTTTATRYFYPLKDLGAKTARITSMMSLGGGQAAWLAPTVGDAWQAFQMWTFPYQDFGDAAGSVRLSLVHEKHVTPAGAAVVQVMGTTPFQRRQVRVDLSLGGNWRSQSLIGLLELGAVDASVFPASMGTQLLNWQGGAIGTGSNKVTIFGPGGLHTGNFVWQGCTISSNDGAYVTIEQAMAFHDTTAPCLDAVGASRIAIHIPAPVGAGISGVGNTGKLVRLTTGSTLYYGAINAAPPFSAASTTDAAPIRIESTDYAVAAIPAVSNTMLRTTVDFP